MTRLQEFLTLIRFAHVRNPAACWGEELRHSLSENLIKVGWGGRIEITDAGRKVLIETEKD